MRIHPAGRGDGGENAMLADIVAVREMRGEQGLDRIVGHAIAGGVAHQPVRIDGGRRAADTIEAESQTFLPPDIGDRRVQAAGAVLAAEFPDDVVGPGHAQARHIGVQQEGAPDQLERDIRAAAQRADQAADAKVAPGTDEIMDNLDPQPGLRWRKDVHV